MQICGWYLEQLVSYGHLPRVWRCSANSDVVNRKPVKTQRANTKEHIGLNGIPEGGTQRLQNTALGVH